MSHTPKLAALRDVNLTGNANAKTLKWDSGTSKFVPADDLNTGVTTLAALTDVDLTGNSDGKVLKWSTAASKFVAGTDNTGSSVTSINDLSDVTISGTPSNGAVLKWNSGTSQWELGADNTSGANGNLDDLLDVTATSPAAGQVISYKSDPIAGSPGWRNRASCWINVLDYGVKNDGTDASSDNHTKIQAALDDLDLAGGGILFFPAGQYVIKATVYVGSQTVLMGAGWGSTDSDWTALARRNGSGAWSSSVGVDWRGTAIIFKPTTRPSNCFELKSYNTAADGSGSTWKATGVQIRNFYMTGAGGTNNSTTANHLIYFDNSDSYVRPFEPDAIHRIQDCFFYYIGGSGVYFKGLANDVGHSRDVQVWGCDFHKCGQAGYAALTLDQSSDAVIIGNTIASTGPSGVGAAIYNVNCPGILVAGGSAKLHLNKTTYNDGSGLRITSSRAFVVGHEAQDEAGHGYDIDTSDCVLIGCKADSCGETNSVSPAFTSYAFNVNGANNQIIGGYATDRGQPGRAMDYALHLGGSASNCVIEIGYGTLIGGFTDSGSFGTNSVRNYRDGYTLNSLTDVALTSPAEGHGVIYSGGQWVNGALATSQTLAAATTAITAPITSPVKFLSSSAGSLTMTAAPTIANGTDGQIVTLVNVDTTDAITLQDQNVLASSNLQLNTSKATLRPGDAITLVYSSTLGDWHEVSRSSPYIRDGKTRVLVYRENGYVYAIARDGTVVAERTDTSTSNRRNTIQDAINYCAGTYTVGHGGGGVVTLSDQLYLTDTTALQLIAPGVSIECPWGQLDRNGFTSAAHAFYGATIVPSGNITNFNVQEGGTQNEQPVIVVGRLATGANYPVQNTPQNENNPHGARIVGINIDMRNAPSSDGILICDTQFVTIMGCNIANAATSPGRGIVVLSTLQPDNGAHGTRIIECMVANCNTGVYVSGSGSTDSFISGCRILQSGAYSCRIGVSGGGGGWQISDCHMTADGTGNNIHVDCAAPATIINNYFDTTGSNHIVIDAPCTVTGNILKSAGSDTTIAPVRMTSNGKKSIVMGNVWQGNRSTKAFVTVDNASVIAFRAIITNNQLGTGNGTLDGTAGSGTFNFDDTVANGDAIFFDDVSDMSGASTYTFYYVRSLAGSSGQLWTTPTSGGSQVTCTTTFSNRTFYWTTQQGVVWDEASGGSGNYVPETASTRTTDFPPYTGPDAVIAHNVSTNTSW